MLQVKETRTFKKGKLVSQTYEMVENSCQAFHKSLEDEKLSKKLGGDVLKRWQDEKHQATAKATTQDDLKSAARSKYSAVVRTMAAKIQEKISEGLAFLRQWPANKRKWQLFTSPNKTEGMATSVVTNSLNEVHKTVWGTLILCPKDDRKTLELIATEMINQVVTKAYVKWFRQTITFRGNITRFTPH